MPPSSSLAARIASARAIHADGGVALHGAAVVERERAFGLIGRSGSGKSTLASLLVERGCALLTEALIRVTLAPADSSREGASRELPRALPGPAELRLCDDAVARLGEAPERFPMVAPTVMKRVVPAARVATRPHPLAVIYVIEDAETDAVVPARGADAADLLVRNLYLERLIDLPGISEALMRCAALASKVPVRRLARKRDVTRLPALVELVLDDLRAAAPA